MSWLDRLNRTREDLAANSALKVDPRTGLELVKLPFGQLLRSKLPPPIWGTLAGSGPAYTFVEAQDSTTGTWAAGVATGTAYEVNGVTGLAGTRQWLRPDRFGTWRFQKIAIGPPGGGVSIDIYGCGPSPWPAGMVGSITLLRPDGTSTTSSTSGGSPSTFSFTALTSGTYSVSFNYPGYWPQTITIPVTLPHSGLITTSAYLASKTFAVTLALDCPDKWTSTTVTLGGGYSGTQSFAAGTTNPLIVNLPDPGGPPPAFTVTVSKDRYLAVTNSYPAAPAPTASFKQACGDTFSLTVDGSCFVCCNCGRPSTKQFSISTPVGTFTVAAVFDNQTVTHSANSHPPTTGTGTIADPYVCGCGQTPSSHAIPFQFQWKCDSSDDSGEAGVHEPSLAIFALLCIDIPYAGTTDVCGTATIGAAGGIVWDSHSCYPTYQWVGHFVPAATAFGGTTNIPELVGTYTVTEVSCVVIDPIDPGGGGGGTMGMTMARSSAPAAASKPDPGLDPEIRAAVMSCPARGPEGGLVLTEEEGAGSCCSGPERTACSLGRGARPGRVTLRECLSCKAEELAR